MVNDYTKFYEALDLKINADDFETWQQLQTLMGDFGFRHGMVPKPNQVNKAWEYLKGKPVPHVPVKYKRKVVPVSGKKPVSRSFVWIVRRNGVMVKQANRDVRFKGRFYRKGMFVPKDMTKEYI